jgi:hypothetical protein
MRETNFVASFCGGGCGPGGGVGYAVMEPGNNVAVKEMAATTVATVVNGDDGDALDEQGGTPDRELYCLVKIAMAHYRSMFFTML